MTKEKYYTYLGTNGIINSPVHLEDTYYTIKYLLTAATGKKLTKDGINFVTQVMVPESEVDEWKEI